MTATKVKQLDDGSWEYSDGSVRNERGQLVKRPPYAAPLINADNAVALAKLAHAQTQTKIQERLLRRALEEGLDATTPADAYAAGVEHLWARTLELDEPLHACVLGQKFAGQAGGFVAPPQKIEMHIGQVNIDQRVAADIDRILAEAEAAGALEGQFAPIEDEADGG